MKVWDVIEISNLNNEKSVELKTGPFGTQFKASEYVENGIPMINVKNIGYGFVVDSNIEMISEKTADRLKEHSLKERDILFGRKGAVDRHAFIKKSNDGWIQGSDCLRLRIKDKKIIEPKYFSYFLLTEYHKQWMFNQCSHGVTMSSLNQEILNRIKIPLPPLPIQKKIAAILSAYDDLIEKNNRRISILEKMAEELYKEWFVRLRFPGHEKTKIKNGIPEGWEVKRLGDVCFEERTLVKKKKIPDNMRYIGLEHITPNSIVIKEYGFAKDIQSDKLYFKEKDILFGKIRPYLHKVSISHFEGVCSSDTIVVRTNDENYQAFVYLTISSDTFVDLATTSSTGTKMPRADWSFLCEQKILIPNYELFKNFQFIFENIFSFIRNNQLQNEILQITRDRLLSRLLSGKIDVEILDIKFPESMQEES